MRRQLQILQPSAYAQDVSVWRFPTEVLQIMHGLPAEYALLTFLVLGLNNVCVRHSVTVTLNEVTAKFLTLLLSNNSSLPIRRRRKSIQDINKTDRMKDCVMQRLPPCVLLNVLVRMVNPRILNLITPPSVTYPPALIHHIITLIPSTLFPFTHHHSLLCKSPSPTSSTPPWRFLEFCYKTDSYLPQGKTQKYFDMKKVWQQRDRMQILDCVTASHSFRKFDCLK